MSWCRIFALLALLVNADSGFMAITDDESGTEATGTPLRPADEPSCDGRLDPVPFVHIAPSAPTARRRGLWSRRTGAPGDMTRAAYARWLAIPVALPPPPPAVDREAIARLETACNRMFIYDAIDSVFLALSDFLREAYVRGDHIAAAEKARISEFRREVLGSDRWSAGKLDTCRLRLNRLAEESHHRAICELAFAYLWAANHR